MQQEKPLQYFQGRLALIRGASFPTGRQSGNPISHCRYVSLFPVMMRILPAKSPELASQLHHLRTGQIMTSHGLRSLSLGSSLHGKRNTEHDPPYWRGPVWMNLNFMMLAALDHYAKVRAASSPFGHPLEIILRMY